MKVDYRQFWGKARPNEGGLPFHPVAWHGLDVAAVFLELLDLWPDEARALAQCFDGDWQEVRRALAVLVAAHDIGKFACAFQAKVPSLVPECPGQITEGLAIDHGAAGLFFFTDRNWLNAQSTQLRGAIDADDFNSLLQPVFGHHGRPIFPASLPTHVVGRADGPCHSAASAFLQEIIALFGSPAFPNIRRGCGAALSWRLAGLIALADWIGSDDAHFIYTDAKLELTHYWSSCAVPRAKAAVRASGLAMTPIAQTPATKTILDPAFTPTAGQVWAAEVPLDNGLFFLEDVMGAGKTEAALVLTFRLMQAERASGLYIGLPTMATANALYQRMANLYQRLFEPGQKPSLILAHSARDLDPRFRQSLFTPAMQAESLSRENYGNDLEDETASAACANWLADDRRKTFFADVGVGTIDQALLALLPVKHCAMRQLGLRRRVLIIDEAHSYEAYMQREIEALIDHQARMDAPVIVLSATLPASIKYRLAKAWMQARSGSSRRGKLVPNLVATDYPLATAIGTQGVAEQPLSARLDLKRALKITRMPDQVTSDQLAIKAAGQGAALARLCNTVDEAIAAYKRLRGAGVAAELFHARFAMCDRLAIEQAALSRFGKASTPDMRRGRVLVATQVVEQSLDLDFDLMISDLAPVDLLLQRAGRVWRHAKRQNRGWSAPELAIVSQAPENDVATDWVAELFPNGQWVYQDHARLWRTAQALFERQELHLPEDMRPLIERVYDSSEEDIPEALKASMMKAAGESIARRGQADINVLDLGKGYMSESGAWGSDIKTPTRLTNERTILRLARLEGGRILPYAQDPEPRCAWALSEVAVSKRRFEQRATLAPALAAQVNVLEEQWQRHNSPALCIPLEPMGSGQWKYTDMLMYSNKTGLEFI